jgi:hypothetical protein
MTTHSCFNPATSKFQDSKFKMQTPLEIKKKRIATFSPGSDGPSISKVGRSTGPDVQLVARNRTDLSGTIFRTPNLIQTPNQILTTSTPVVPPLNGETVQAEQSREHFEDSITEQLQSSMKEIPKNTNVYSSPNIEFVIIDAYKKNGADFNGTLPRELLRFFWLNLGRSLEEVKILSCDRTAHRSLRITANLRRGLSLSIAEITNSYESQVEIPSATAIGAPVDVFNIRFPQFKDLVCELGQEVTVTFKKVPPEVSCSDLRNWLSLFGETNGGFRYQFLLLD